MKVFSFLSFSRMTLRLKASIFKGIFLVIFFQLLSVLNMVRQWKVPINLGITKAKAEFQYCILDAQLLSNFPILKSDGKDII